MEVSKTNNAFERKLALLAIIAVTAAFAEYYWIKDTPLWVKAIYPLWVIYSFVLYGQSCRELKKYEMPRIQHMLWRGLCYGLCCIVLFYGGHLYFVRMHSIQPAIYEVAIHFAMGVLVVLLVVGFRGK